MKIYIRSSVVTIDQPALEVTELCDGKETYDTVQPNSFYLEAQCDGDTIWVGKTSEEDTDEYSLETAKEGHVMSSPDLYEVLDTMISMFDISRHDFVDIFNFARNYV